MAERGYDAYYPPTALVPVFLTHASDFYDNGAIRTLFIAGLPDDVKAREIHNLFRLRPGFDSCQLKYTGLGNQVVAFSTFFNHQSAIAAMHSLNVRVYGSEPYVVIDNRPKDKSNEQETSSNDGDDESEEEGPSKQENPSEDEDPSGEEDDNSGSASNLAKRCKAAPDHELMRLLLPHCMQENTRSSVQNLNFHEVLPLSFGGETADNESALWVVAAVLHGLKILSCKVSRIVALRIRARGGTPLAFADFEEIEQVTKAMEGLQGAVLTSSDHGGMSI